MSNLGKIACLKHVKLDSFNVIKTTIKLDARNIVHVLEIMRTHQVLEQNLVVLHFQVEILDFLLRRERQKPDNAIVLKILHCHFLCSQACGGGTASADADAGSPLSPSVSNSIPLKL